jgi:predicted anti-sigma-YlaC factor YlaD
MMTCNEARRLRARFFAMDLAAEHEAEVSRHVDACAECRGVFATSEPSFGMALALRRGAPVGDSRAFVAEVMAGLRQRRSERTLESRRRRWPLSLAAAALLTLATGLVLTLGPGSFSGQRAAGRSIADEGAVEPALVEVEGEGVRVYQLATDGEGAIRVAFIVDPQMEL